MQEYLRARYYLPPSRLYSAVRLLPDKHGYDVPVAGDWVTITVVAEGAPSSSLIDFGPRSRLSSSATGGKAVIRGATFLTLSLFKSDAIKMVTSEDGKVEKLYEGGSHGGFEAMSKLKEGDVIALLNPKILKPFQACSPIYSFSKTVLILLLHYFFGRCYHQRHASIQS
jgi:minichromosome maintenance protein 10